MAIRNTNALVNQQPEYKPASHKYRAEQKAAAEEERVVKKVVNGGAKLKKRSGVSKFTDVFVSEDAENVKSYILKDVLIPGIKKIVSNIVRDGIDMILYGDVNRSDSRSGSYRPSYISYNKYSDRDRDRREEPRTRFDYDLIAFPHRGMAEDVRDEMENVIGRYGFVTVADYYEIADGGTPPYTSGKYGWTSLRNAEIVRTRDGDYIIKLPKALPIDY